MLTDAQGATKARDMDNETLRMKLGEAWEVFVRQVLPVMTPRPLNNGMGTEQSPYLIATLDDWHRLCISGRRHRGRKDNYVFEAGMHYMFNVSIDGDYDRVDVGALPT